MTIRNPSFSESNVLYFTMQKRRIEHTKFSGHESDL